MDDVELALFERQVEAIEAIGAHVKSLAPPRPGRRTGGSKHDGYPLFDIDDAITILEDLIDGATECRDTRWITRR